MSFGDCKITVRLCVCSLRFFSVILNRWWFVSNLATFVSFKTERELKLTEKPLRHLGKLKSRHTKIQNYLIFVMSSTYSL